MNTFRKAIMTLAAVSLMALSLPVSADPPDRITFDPPEVCFLVWGKKFMCFPL